LLTLRNPVAETTNFRRWVNQHSLAAYYLLAYACSWIIALPLALQTQGILSTHLPLSLHYLTAFGPAVAAAIVQRLVREPQEHPKAAGSAKNRVTWVAIGFVSPLLLFGFAQLCARILGQPAASWTELGQVNFLPDLGLGAWLLWFLTNGWGEEVGWRGFALPHLQHRHSALVSSVLVSGAWAGWHLPAFFYLPSYLALGWRLVPGFFLGILAGAIILTWLYNSSGGSLLAVVLWHASFNFVSASPNVKGLTAAIISTLVMVWALLALWRFGPATLAPRIGKR
jgi:membrane protease YdiL (CAAX protease family)